MAKSSRHPGIRLRTLLGAFLVHAFSLLPMLGAAHLHEEDPGHSPCQLCLVHSQACEPPAGPTLPAAAAILLFRIPDAAAGAPRILPVTHASRGPPSA